MNSATAAVHDVYIRLASLTGLSHGMSWFNRQLIQQLKSPMRFVPDSFEVKMNIAVEDIIEVDYERY
jgi:uncharacterized membrane protein YpjA